MPTKIRTLFLELFAALQQQFDLPRCLSRQSKQCSAVFLSSAKARVRSTATEYSLSDVTAVLRLGVAKEVIDMHRQCRIIRTFRSTVSEFWQSLFL